MPEMSSDEIPGTLAFLVTVTDEGSENSMGLFSQGEGKVALCHIPVAALRENLNKAIGTLRSVFEEAAREDGALRLREAHIGLEISGTGGISLIGTSQIGAKAAITLVFGE